MATTCPFCGVITDTPHETQAGCIASLQLEIARVRDILELSHPSSEGPEPETDSDPRDDDDQT